MRNGVPFEIALGPGAPKTLDRVERIAMAVVLGQLEGGEFNWLARRWEEPE